MGEPMSLGHGAPAITSIDGRWAGRHQWGFDGPNGAGFVAYGPMGHGATNGFGGRGRNQWGLLAGAPMGGATNGVCWPAPPMGFVAYGPMGFVGRGPNGFC